RQHREHKEVQISEESVKAAVAFHIAGREDVDQKPDERYETNVNGGKMIHSEREIRTEPADVYPRPDMVEHRLFREHRTAVRYERDVKRDDARKRDRTARDNA